MSIRTRIIKVEILHGNKTLTFSIHEGEDDIKEGRTGSYQMWCVDLEDKENSSIVTNDVGQSVLSLYGVNLDDSTLVENQYGGNIYHTTLHSCFGIKKEVSASDFHTL